MPPHRKKAAPPRATLRQVLTLECLLDHYVQRDKAFRKAVAHAHQALRNGLSAEAMVKEMEQSLSELETRLQVAQRLHDLAMEQAKSAKYPDEDPE